MSKDYIVLCLDVGPSMNISPPVGGDTHLEMAVKIINQIVQQKMFAGAKDYVGLVLFGTADTENELNTSSGKGYENITVAWNLDQPSLDFLRFVNNNIQPGPVSADFIDALVVSMDVVVNATKNASRVGDKKVYLITDAASQYSDDGLDRICAGLKREQIDLIIVGPNLEPRGEDGAPRHPPPPPPSGGDEGGGGKDISSGGYKTAQQVAGEAVLQRVMEDIEGVSFSFHEALEVASFIRKTAKKQTTRFAGCLELGDLKLNCKVFTKVMAEKPASWKKLSAISQASANPGTMAVKMQRSYHRMDEDETEVDPDDISKGYRYGKSLIPITDADEEAMKLNPERQLCVLGFTKASAVKHQCLIGSSVQVVVGPPDDENASTAMSALIHALYETDMVGVARYVWRKNATPKLLALVPSIKADRECLLMFQLPFMEDIRQFVFASLPGKKKHFEPTADQLAAVDDLISTMDLMTADIDEDGERTEALQPKLIPNPVIQRTFQCIQHRALHPGDPLPELQPHLARLVQPSEALLRQCSDSLQRIKDLFPITKVEKKADQNSAANVWRMSGPELDLETEAPLSKKPRVEGEEFSMASLAKGDVTQVGTVDPVEDYRKLMRQDSNNFIDVSKQLQNVVFKLVKESFGDTYYDKALSCVTALREESIKHAGADVFNKFLRDLKEETIGTRYAPFWDRVTKGGVNPHHK
ncbi:hypothetical protein EMCRGX_G014997 [Ephydatia muelleri]